LILLLVFLCNCVETMKSVVSLMLAMLASVALGAMDLYKLEEAAAQKGAVCLDGSPGAYYFRAASTPSDNDKWIIFLPGGGWCYKSEDCLERSKTSLGSSDLMKESKSADGVLSEDPSENPDFYTWNHVMIAYCDGASFTGTADDPDEVGGTKIYYRGYRILEAAIEDLMKKHGLNKATQVLVAGSSAGGLAAFIHADQIAEMLPNTVQRYKVAPMSGLFLAHDNVLGESVYEPEMKMVYMMQNSTFGVASQCLVSKSPMYMYLCLFAAETASYISSPLFVMNSMYDLWSLQCIYSAEPVNPQSSMNGNCSAVPGWDQCLSSSSCTPEQIRLLDDGWGEDFRKTYKSKSVFSKKGNGFFAYSCISHGDEILGYWNKVAINGVTIREALGKWFFSNNQEASKHTYIDCTLNGKIQCNPTCSR